MNSLIYTSRYVTCDKIHRREIYGGYGLKVSHILNFDLAKVKRGKVHPRTGHEGPDGEQRYSCTFFLISALNGVGVILRLHYARKK
jgi:hypothetical protein